MQPFSFDGTSSPAPRTAREPGSSGDSPAQDRPSPCNDPELRQAIHQLRRTLDLLPE